MTFSALEISNIAIDLNDDWQFNHDDRTLSCRFYGLEEYVERFFNKTRDEYGNSWIDCYAVIDYINKTVDHIECVYSLDELDEENKELNISFTNKIEPIMILKQLYKTSYGALEKMVEEAIEEE